MDIFCFLAEGVLAGGIRRSSLIGLFSIEDSEMMVSKAHGHFVPDKVNPQRAMMNISGVCLRGKVTFDQFNRLVSLAREWGEPGFFFTDDLDHGTNPCGEIGLNPVLASGALIRGEDRTLDFVPGQDGEEDPSIRYGNRVGWQFCNLCEINGAVIEAEHDFLAAAEAASFIGTLQASFTDLPYLGPVTEIVVRRDALIGVGLTGIMDNPGFCLNAGMLQRAADKVKLTNQETAYKIGIEASPRSTTVKPGGTAPLALGGVASGITPHHSRRYFRRVTANTNEGPAVFLYDQNPQMFEMKPNGDWAIVFCIEAPDDAIVLSSVDCFEQLDNILVVYRNWVERGRYRDTSPGHNVSCTVVVDDDDWDELIGRVWDERHNLCAMSFLPRIGDKQYPFAPREAVVTEADEARWNEICSSYSTVDWSLFREDHDETDLGGEAACANGACDV